MQKLVSTALVALTLLACGGEDPALRGDGAAASGNTNPKKIFEAERMTGVARPYVGQAAGDPLGIRGVPAGGLPWVIEEGEAKLWDDGTLQVKVRGLVFDPNDATVIARGLANQNTVASFRAIVSCQTIEGGAAVTRNVTTGLFPATTGAGAGDADILERLALPSPCYGPIVFVTNPNGAWFAVTSL